MIFRLTDKDDTKTLPCTGQGCPHMVIVTKFFSASKAVCPSHGYTGKLYKHKAPVEAPAPAPKPVRSPVVAKVSPSPEGRVWPVKSCPPPERTWETEEGVFYMKCAICHRPIESCVCGRKSPTPAQWK